MTTIQPVGGNEGALAAYFRKTFATRGVSIARDTWLRLRASDGVIVYLNGGEIFRRNMPQGPAVPETPALKKVTDIAGEVFSLAPVEIARRLLLEGDNVIAAEVHSSGKADPDLYFDLELSANLASTQTPPEVRIRRPLPGARFLAGELVTVEAAGIDTDGAVKVVAFTVDGELAGLDSDPPYSSALTKLKIGRHRIVATATDNDGLTGESVVDIIVEKDLAPMVEITSPEQYQQFPVGAHVMLVADAEDRGGKIVKVEFFLRNGHGFAVEDDFKPVGAATSPPYEAELMSLSPGHYMAIARATDNSGQTGDAPSVHFEVVGEVRPGLSIELMPGGLAMITWDSPKAILEYSDTLPAIAWTSIPNVASPFHAAATEKKRFYRLRLP